MQQFELQLKEAVNTITRQATNLMQDVADYELVSEQTHSTTVNELFRLAEAQQTQEKAQPVYKHPVARDQNGMPVNSGMEGDGRLDQSQQSTATGPAPQQGGGNGAEPNRGRRREGVGRGGDQPSAAAATVGIAGRKADSDSRDTADS